MFLACGLIAMGACQLVVDTSGLAGGATGDAGSPESGTGEGGATEGGSAEGGRADAGAVDGDAADASASAPTLVQAQFHPESNVTSFSMSLSAPSGSGHTLLLAVGASDNQSIAVKGAGLTWTLVSQTTPHVPVSVWSAAAVAGATASVTVDFPGTQATTLGTFTEWANLGALDTIVLAEGVSMSVATGPIATTSGELVFAAAALHNYTTGTPTNPFSGLDSVSAGDARLLVAYTVAASPGSFGTSWSASTAGGWNTILLTFHPR